MWRQPTSNRTLLPRCQSRRPHRKSDIFVDERRSRPCMLGGTAHLREIALAPSSSPELLEVLVHQVNLPRHVVLVSRLWPPNLNLWVGTGKSKLGIMLSTESSLWAGYHDTPVTTLRFSTDPISSLVRITPHTLRCPDDGLESVL